MTSVHRPSTPAGHPGLHGDQLAARLRTHLDRAGSLEEVHVEERIGDRLRNREQAMVAQHEEVLLTQIANQPRLLLLIERQSLVIMVSERGQNDGRMLRDRQDAVLLRRHGDAVAAVQMEDARRIFTRRVDRTVDRKSGGVDVVGAGKDLLPIDVDLHQNSRR